MSSPVPVCLFAYARPLHLSRVLNCLQQEAVPLIYAFCDASKSAKDASAVHEVRQLVAKINWAEVKIVERENNMGLGANVLDGVSKVAAEHETFIVWEDDLVCAPGTYSWLCLALTAYKDALSVGSVTGWTHPRVLPQNLGTSPYFDGRAECWVWGSWSRVWKGMNEETAWQKMLKAENRGVQRAAYGADLPKMAKIELIKNIWAVRLLYHHFAHGLLCLRPPWSMIEHIGFDGAATHAASAAEWGNSPLKPRPEIPASWPIAVENIECAHLWRRAARGESFLQRAFRRVFR